MSSYYPKKEYCTFNLRKSYHEPRHHNVCNLQSLVLDVYDPVKYSPIENITMGMNNFANSLSLFKVDDEYLQLVSHWCVDGDTINFDQVTRIKIDILSGPIKDQEVKYND